MKWLLLLITSLFGSYIVLKAKTSYFSSQFNGFIVLQLPKAITLTSISALDEVSNNHLKAAMHALKIDP